MHVTLLFFFRTGPVDMELLQDNVVYNDVLKPQTRCLENGHENMKSMLTFSYFSCFH